MKKSKKDDDFSYIFHRYYKYVYCLVENAIDHKADIKPCVQRVFSIAFEQGLTKNHGKIKLLLTLITIHVVKNQNLMNKKRKL